MKIDQYCHFFQKKKKLKRELPPSPPSPWAVGSLTEFLHFKCPICDFTCKEESAFLQHAYQFHKESVVYLCSLTIEDPGNVVLEDPDFFDNDDHQVWTIITQILFFLINNLCFVWSESQQTLFSMEVFLLRSF